jgi:hypothetical protein
MRDGILDKGVYRRYCNKIILIADWAAINQLDCFTPFGLEKSGKFKVPLEDKNKIRRQKRMKEGWMDILKNSHHVAVFDHEMITACVVSWNTSHHMPTRKPGNLYPRLEASKHIFSPGLTS